MAIPEGEGATLTKEQAMDLRALCELADPAPLLARIKELIPAYKSVPVDKHSLSQNPDFMG